MSELLHELIDTARASTPRGWLVTHNESGQFEQTAWSDIHADARRAAGVLRARGVAPGSAVALFMGSPRHVAVAVQACWLVGASVTMLHQPTARTNLGTYAEETFGILAMIDADALVLGPPYADIAEHFSAPAELAGTLVIGAADFASGTASIEVDADVVGEAAPALLQLTSGSTSAPKAVTITHGNLISNMRAMAVASEITDDDVMVSWLPVFHDMGMVGFLSVPMVFGYQLVKMTPAEFVASPTSWMRAISDFGGSITAAPNFAYGVAARSLQKATDLDLSSLRIALNGAEPVDPRTVQAFCQAGERHGLNSAAVLCAYGMAEAALAVSFAPVGRGLRIDTVDSRALIDDRVAKPTSEAGSAFALLGPPLNGIEVEVRGADASRLAERQVGSIMIRGAAITPGYCTPDGLQPAQDEQGWLDTGDEGYLVDGEVVICGRAKDLIILAGRNIFPTDIERAAERVDGVRAGNCAAVSVAISGRESCAIMAESTYVGDPQQVERLQHDIRLAVFADLDIRPGRVVIVAPGALPKTPSGKVQRSRVQAVLRQILDGDDSSA